MFRQQTLKIFMGREVSIEGWSSRRLDKLPAHIYSRAIRTSITASNATREPSSESGSLFRTSSAWDYVFQDLDKLPPLSPSAIRKSIQKPSNLTETNYRGRKQTMTMQETATVAKMFNFVFDKNMENSSRDPLANAGLGLGPGQKTKVEQILEDMDRAEMERKERAEKESAFDRLQERIETFQTDIELLQWALTEVLHIDAESGEPTRKTYDYTYGNSIALLMRAFRDKFRDPHIALSIFHHAKHLSIESFVSGCTSSSYHEYIVTVWTCFRDIKSVYDAVEEMSINGITPNSFTRTYVDSIRREVFKDTTSEDASVVKFEVMRLVTRIDSLLAKKRRSKRSADREPWNEQWKASEGVENGYEFGNWDGYAAKVDHI